jgi:hypothetical protein
MSRARIFATLFGLALGLLFYLAYRTDQTLSNRLVGALCDTSTYDQLKHALRAWLPIPVGLRGCLPSALWCFLVVSLAGGWRVRLQSGQGLSITWLPPLFNAGWEMIQWLGWTDGHPDWKDGVAGYAGWLLSLLMFSRTPLHAAEISALGNWRVFVVVAGFASMALADASK